MKTEETTTTANETTKTTRSPKSRKAAKSAAKKSKRAKTKTVTKKQTSKQKSAPTAGPAKPEARSGSKSATILELLRRKEGATIAEIAKATGWQNHSIRGFLSGHVTKKMGLGLESAKNDAGERTYRLPQ